MKKYHLYSMAILCLSVAVAFYSCAPTKINGGGTLPSASGNTNDKANFGFYGENCTPSVINGVINYHDKKAPTWPNGGLKLNGEVIDVARCSEWSNSSNASIACGICNLQFCSCPGWPETWESCLSNFLIDPLSFCQNMQPIPGNLYGAVFNFRSTNSRYSGTGLGVACVTDNGEGRGAIDEDYVVLIVTFGQYYGYINQGTVQGNIESGPCCHDLCLTGFPPVTSCDPCVAEVCAVDSFCCDTEWNSECIAEAQSICGLTCVE